MFHQVFICDTGQNPQDAELESEAGPSSQEPQALDSSMKEEPESMAMETDTGSMPDEVDPNENEELKGKFDAEEKGIIHNLVPIAPPDEDSKVARKKASLKGPRSLVGEQNKRANSERKIEIISGRTNNDSNTTKKSIKQQTAKSTSSLTKKPAVEKIKVVTNRNKYAFAKNPSSVSKKKSTRKDKENFVFIFILDDQKGHSHADSKSPEENSMDVIDLSSVLDENFKLFDNLTEKHHRCRPEDVKKLVENFIGELSKRSAPLSHPKETNKIGHQYYLVLNCPIPFNVTEYPNFPPQAKTSNRKPLKSNKPKTMRRQPAITKQNVSSKGVVHKFKGGLTKRYLSDNGNKEGYLPNESFINQNNMESDIEDYADNISNDFNENQESDEETTPPSKTRKAGSSKLRLAVKKTVKKSKLNVDISATETTMDEESKKQFICERCAKSFNTMKLLKTHQKRKSCINREAIELKKMEIQKSKEEGIEGTYGGAEVAKDEPLTCEICKGNFKNKRTLTHHIKAVCNGKSTGKNQGAGEAICDICGKKCRNRSYLLEHIACHENLRAFSCLQCGKSFNRSGFLRKHMRTVHGNLKYQYFCSHCGLRSESKEHIEKHEQVHTLPEGVPMPTPFQCNCGKAFISKHALRCHKSTSCKHRNRAMRDKPEPPVECPVCKKMCRNRAALRMHKYNCHRSDGMEFNCDPCRKTFRTRGGLISHNKREHRPPELTHVWCGLCQKEFKDRSALWAHQKYVHTEGSPHRCGECGSKFKRKGDYTRHLKDRHGARPPQPVPEPPAPVYPSTPAIETYFGGFL